MLIFVLVLTGCSTKTESSTGGSSDMSNSYSPADKPEGGESSKDSEQWSESATTIAANASRKVIFTYSYQLETITMNETLAALESAILTSGGYIENASYTGRKSDDQFANATLTCRIPIASVSAFKKTIETNGNVRAKSEVGRDITDEYYDVEARLTVLYSQEERLLYLLGQRGALSDLLEIERELNRVRTEIERLTGTLKKYDGLVDYATFKIEVYNVSEYTYTPPEKETFLEQLGRSFLDSLDIALGVLQSLLIALVYILPYAVIAGLVAFICVRITRARRRKHPAKPPRQKQPKSSPPVPAVYYAPAPPMGSPASVPPMGSPASAPPPANIAPVPPLENCTTSGVKAPLRDNTPPVNYPGSKAPDPDSSELRAKDSGVVKKKVASENEYDRGERDSWLL